MARSNKISMIFKNRMYKIKKKMYKTKKKGEKKKEKKTQPFRLCNYEPGTLVINTETKNKKKKKKKKKER